MRLFLFCCVLACLLVPPAAANNGFYLKNGDVVVFYGDSITDARLYTAITEAYVLTRFPDLHVRFISSGVAGDRVSGGALGSIDVRLERDVIAHRPTVVTVLLGMNDGGYRAFDADLFRDFTTGYEHIVGTLRKALPRARITLLEPTPYDDVTRPPLFEGGYESVMVRYGQWVREFGRSEHLPVAETNSGIATVLRAVNQKDPALAQKIIPDRVHPSMAGHLLIAAELLKLWNAPALVTAVDIDASSGRILRAENTRISEFHGGPSFTWTQLDRSLPMPIDWKDSTVNAAVHSSDLMSALDNEVLRIRNLEPGEYVLGIDDEPVGTFTEQQLGDTIDLAQLDTPMLKQAGEVMLLSHYRSAIQNVRWRNVQVSLEKYSFAHKAPTVDALNGLEEEIIAAQRTAAQPKLHRYELRRTGPRH